MLAASAILWTALAPLSGAVYEVLSDNVQPLCHQAGMQVEAGSKPMAPPGGKSERKSHCPLCIMVFFGGAVQEATVPPYVYVRTLSLTLPDPAPLARRFEIFLPQGRAPPHSFA